MTTPKRHHRNPRYALHKATGQARTIIDGRHVYLGKYGTPASWERYQRMLAERGTSAAQTSRPTDRHPLTVAELMAAYWEHVIRHYVKDGRPTGEQNNIRAALRPALELYGRTSAADFGPLALKACRGVMIDAGMSRGVVNQNIGRIRRMFKWAVAEELLPSAVWQSLCAVQGLLRGRSSARDTEPVPPVSESAVDATLPYLPPIVADMVRFQRLTGARPGEVCALRPCDVDRTGEVWCYRPASHKMQHHGRERVVFVGPKAAAVLLPYLLRDAQAFCFSPAESEAKRKAMLRENRKSQVQPSQRDRSKPRAKRKPADRYTRFSYAKAIHRACRAADATAHAAQPTVPVVLMIVPNWHPNQLRHAAATEIRSRYGLEAAQVVLGHSKADVTQVYAERDFAKAESVMREVG